MLADAADLAAIAGRAEPAARLFGAAAALRAAADVSLRPLERADQDRTATAIRAELDEATFEVARAAGAALPLEAAIAEADALLRSLEEAPEPTTPSAPAVPVPGGLSPRELEVVRLLAAGQSNQEIADELVVSHSTAVTHVRNILTKLGLDSRAAVAAWAVRHGLA
jgi:DNA-binding NarL/FixJ family response regulator